MSAEPDLFRIRWESQLERDAKGAPTLSPLFVLEQGLGVRLVDLRSPAEAEGILGHIPGSEFLDVERIARDAPVVLIDRDGRDAANVALELESARTSPIAAMRGGLAAWRRLGLGTSREPVRRITTRPARVREGLLSLDEVRAHVGDPRAVRWIKFASLAGLGHSSCVDGRDERGVIGTPGGDAGEFLLSLAAFERVEGSTLDEETVARALLAHLDSFGDMYMHTDVHAVEKLLEDVRQDGPLESAVADIHTPDELKEFLRDPGDGHRETLLEHLVDPAYIGCGHIRLMLQHSEEYGIRRELVVSFLRTVWRLWWRGAPELRITTLPGGHGEAAVLNVRLEEELWELSLIPLVSPACAGIQSFVNHPDVISRTRKAKVQFHLRGLGPLHVAPSRAVELQAAVDELAAQQLQATLGHLAQGLPIYEVMFAREGGFEVRQA